MSLRSKFIAWTLLFWGGNFNIYSQHYKIAFVKQVVYQDLYCCDRNASAAEIVFSSFKRSGPVALFSKLNADFYIVDTEFDSECNIWREKGIAECNLIATHLTPRGIVAGHTYPQAYYAIKASEVNWGQYDIVIAMECAIPTRIIKKYPATLWAYYIGEGCSSFQRSFQAPLAGYDCFFSQDFAVKSQHKAHVIEFPYQLQYYGCFHELLGLIPGAEYRSGIYCEHHTGLYLSAQEKQLLDQLSPILKKTGNNFNSLVSLKSMINDMLQSKYFIIFLEKKAGRRSWLRGNAIPEAIAAGNLVIARDFGIANKSLFTDATLVHDFSELLSRIEFFEKNPAEYQKELEAQRRKLDYYCFERPIQELYASYKMKKAAQFRNKNHIFNGLGITFKQL